MQTPYWEHFLAIEGDLDRTGRYVEFCDANMETYSIEFSRLLLACGSEVDVVLRACNTMSDLQEPETNQHQGEVEESELRVQVFLCHEA